jgi:hypothetical protein
MPKSQQLFFGLRLVTRIFEEFQKSRNQSQNSAALWRIFSVCQPIGRKDSLQIVILQAGRLDSFLYEAAQNFEVFSDKFKIEITNKKLIAVDVFFKAYRMVPLSCRSHMARQCL